MDAPLKLCPFIMKLISKLSQKLDDHITDEILLREISGSNKQATVASDWDYNLIFPVKRSQLICSRSDSVEF
jgi:hypothetical protein